MYTSKDFYKTTLRWNLVDKFRKKPPAVGNSAENSSSQFLLRSLSFPQSLLSRHLPCLLSVFIHRSGHVSLFISPLYFFSHLVLHAHRHACIHSLTCRPQKLEPVVALEQESVDERRPICDWMTE